MFAANAQDTMTSKPGQVETIDIFSFSRQKKILPILPLNGASQRCSIITRMLAPPLFIV